MVDGFLHRWLGVSVERAFVTSWGSRTSRKAGISQIFYAGFSCSLRSSELEKRYVAHVVGDVLQHHFWLMGLQRNLSKQIDQPNRQKKILESLMRDDVEEKADEF